VVKFSRTYAIFQAKTAQIRPQTGFIARLFDPSFGAYRMKRKTKHLAGTRGRGTLLLVLAAVLFVVILLLRLLLFVTPHGRHHF